MRKLVGCAHTGALALLMACMLLASTGRAAPNHPLPEGQRLAWVKAREAWREAARAVVDGDLDKARPEQWAKSVALVERADWAMAEGLTTSAMQHITEATQIAADLHDTVLTERNAKRAEAMVEAYCQARARNDRFAAEVFLAALEEMIPADKRLEGSRKEVVKLPGPGPLTLILAEGVEMTFARVPSGWFVMGSNQGPTFRFKETKNGRSYELPWQFDGPPHEVILKEAFLMTRCEVTQGQWKALLGELPEGCPDLGPDYPVWFQDWKDTQTFLRALRTKCPDLIVDLPTEQQWERACRGGTGSEYYFSLDGNHLDEYEWAGCVDKPPKGPMPVGQKKPNAYGLHDMAGNVMEWCKDIYKPYAGSLMPADTVNDPMDPEGKPYAVRGGCWASPLPEQFRSACRHPSHYGMGAGFRVVVALDVRRARTP